MAPSDSSFALRVFNQGFPPPSASSRSHQTRKQSTVKYTAQSVRSVPIRIITVGKKRSAGVRLLVEEYISKIQHYCAVDDLPIRSNPNNARDARVQVNDEDASMLNLITTNDLVVVLDEHGKDIASEQMAELIADAGNSGASRLSFCIGGPYGHGQGMRKRSDHTIKLSSMVLNHEVALIVLVEQLYRAWTILKGQNYHH